MGRPPRFDYESAWHHVMNQRAARLDMFRSDGDRRYFLSLVAELEERHGVEVHAYAAMGNHYHLLVRSRDALLADAMHRLDGLYARHYNDRYDRVGSFFRSRYTSRLVEDEAYRSWLGVYIHLNPVTAGFVQVPEESRWSSFRSYVDLDPSPPFLHTQVLRADVDGAGYQAFTSGYVSNEHMADAGSPVEVEQAWRKSCGLLLPIEMLEDRVADAFEVPLASLRLSLPGVPNEARTAVFALAHRWTDLTNVALARRYGLRSPSTVAAASKRFERFLSRRPGQAARLRAAGILG